MTKKVVERGEDGKPTGAITFQLDDGSSIRFDHSQVPDDTKFYAMVHGFSQKIGDAYANAAKAESPLEFTRNAITDTIAQLVAGDWRASAGPGEPRYSDLAIALSRVTGKPIAEVHAQVEGMDKAQKKVYRAKKKVAAALAELRLERLRAQMARAEKNAGDLGGEFEGDGEDEDEEVTL